MNLFHARLHGPAVAIATLGAILGLAAVNIATGQPADDPAEPSGQLPPPLPAPPKPADAPAVQEKDEPPQRPWWDPAPGRPGEEVMLPAGSSTKPRDDGLLEIENQLRRRAEMILRELVELPVGSDSEARRLEAELKRVREDINRLHEDFARPNRWPKEPEPNMFEALGERLELAQEAIDVQCMIYELDGEDRQRAAELEDELKEIEARLEAIVARHPELKNDREFLKQQMEFQRRASQRMSQAGKTEAAARFMRDQLAIVRQLDEPLPDSPVGRVADRRQDLDRRVKHVEVAVENLRAAGLDDFAESLVQELARMVDEDRRQGPGLSPAAPRFDAFATSEDPFPPPAGRPDTPDLHRQIDQMRREMDELRELVEVLVRQNRSAGRD